MFDTPVQVSPEQGNVQRGIAANPNAAGSPIAPEYGVDGRLTRRGMETVIASGGGVMLGKRVVTRIDDLPTHASMAAGNPDEEKAMRKSIAQRRAELDKEELLLSKPADASSAKKQSAFNQ